METATETTSVQTIHEKADTIIARIREDLNRNIPITSLSLGDWYRLVSWHTTTSLNGGIVGEVPKGALHLILETIEDYKFPLWHAIQEITNDQKYRHEPYITLDITVRLVKVVASQRETFTV